MNLFRRLEATRFAAGRFDDNPTHCVRVGRVSRNSFAMRDVQTVTVGAASLKVDVHISDNNAVGRNLYSSNHFDILQTQRANASIHSLIVMHATSTTAIHAHRTIVSITQAGLLREPDPSGEARSPGTVRARNLSAWRCES